MSGATSATVDVKYDFTPYDGTPGDMYDKFEERLMNGATRADDRGWSLADHYGGVDEGRLRCDALQRRYRLGSQPPEDRPR